MHIALPDETGKLSIYRMIGIPIAAEPLPQNSCRVVFAAAHVVNNPFLDVNPVGSSSIDWEATLRFRRHLAALNLGIAESMDTAQRGMGLNWTSALELIRQTRTELPDALVFNGCGTDHLVPNESHSLDDIVRAYLDQVSAVQLVGGQIILMASRALAIVARSADDYEYVYGRVLSECNEPVILHWLGSMFDPALKGYWGSNDIPTAMSTALSIISSNQNKIDGIKISLLDQQQEIRMRRKLPAKVRMYTGDDFNYTELIAGDEQGFSHALLGVFDPLATAAATAGAKLSRGDIQGFKEVLEPTIPLARHIFKSPTQHYKSGIVFLAWLNGFQDHFTMINGAQAHRSLQHYVEIFRLADASGSLMDPELSIQRMQKLLAFYGIPT